VLAEPAAMSLATTPTVRRCASTIDAMQVIFAVSDLTRSLAFYERAFDWPRNDRVDFANDVELLPPDGGAVGLYERSGFAAQVGAAPVAIENGAAAPAYLDVRVRDVAAAAARLDAAGGRRLTPLARRAWGESAAWFADPDGDVVAVGGIDDS
jgi:catechol 2,3-dioxygenase-like lactoylglutathione lyase family enzyme